MRKYLIFGLTALFLFAPFFVFAADPLIPDSIATGKPQDIRACDIFQVANNLIRFAVQLAVAAAALMFAYAGFLYVTASAAGEEQLRRAKKIFGYVFLGLVVVLIAWIVIDLVLTVFTNKGFGERTIQCVDAPHAAGSGGGLSTINTDLPRGSDDRTEQENRALFDLSGVGIKYNGNDCPDGVTTGCVSVGGFDPGTVVYIVHTKNACDQVVGAECEITLTGGSEGGHAGGTRPGSHAAGDKFDLRLTQNVDSYISSQVESGNFYQVDPPRWGIEQYVDSDSDAVWTLESDHWDVCVNNCDAPPAYGT